MHLLLCEQISGPHALHSPAHPWRQCFQVPLYASGDDPNAKQFRSLHAVQRHMVDTNQCKLLYDGNEEEYAEFYDYSSQEDAAAAAAAAAGADGQIIVNDGGFSSGPALSAAGYELVVGGDSSSGSGTTKVLGSRDLARYYKQRPKPEDTRQSVVINTVLAEYRSLGIETKDTAGAPPEVKRVQRQQQRKERSRLNLAMRTNINRDLPKNVPY
jgi:pre-60S factor REI1